MSKSILENKLNTNNDKKNEKNLISDAQEIFVQEKLENDITFFNNISNLDIFLSFKNFLNTNPRYKELSLNITWFNNDQKDSLVEQIKEENMKFLFVRKKNLKDLEKIFSREYDSLKITDLSLKLSKLSITELSKLIKSDIKRRKFLKENWFFSDDENLLKSRKKEEDFLLKSIKISKSSYNKLSDDQKESLAYLFQNDSHVSISDLDSILSCLSDDKSKVNLLKYFVSTISLEDLEKHNLLSTSKKEIIIKNIKDELWVSSDKANQIFSSLPKSNIFLDLDDLDNVNLTSLINNNSFKRNIIEEYNSELDSWDDENKLRLSLDSKWNINNSFINLIKNDKNISENIRNSIWLFQNWNILELSQWWKKWYYYIKKVDNWNNLETKNIIFENITWDGWFIKPWTWYEEKYSYSKIYDLFKKASNSSELTNISFSTFDSLKSSWVLEVLDSSDIINYEDLLSALDSVDQEGKWLWLSEDWTVLVDKKEWFVFLIKNINKRNNTIIIDQWWYWDVKVSFRDFYKTFKSSSDLKRVKKINSFSDWVSSWESSISSLKLENNKLIDSIKDKNSKYPIKYLSWEWWKSIYIDSISENSISYFIWNIKEVKDWKKIKRNFKSESKSSNFNQFFEDIKKFNMSPALDSNLEKELDNQKEVKTKWSLLTKFLSGLSISEIIASFSFITEWIKKKLSRWNRLKSLKFAQKFTWILGKDMALTLQSMAEQEEKSLSEEIMSDLKSLGSKEMLIKIRKIIENKDSEQYEIIACLMTVASKYGTLYPKWLKDMSWSLHWYKILWWTKEFERNYRKEISSWKSTTWKEEVLNFTEEWLVEAWLKELAKEGKVRSKLDKDFWNLLNSWRNEELEDWKNKVWDQITNHWKLNYFVWELENKTYANALWGIEKIYSKNSTPQDMQAVWFILAISWYWKNFDQVLVKHIQWLLFTTPYLSLAYWYSEEWHKKYKALIEKLIIKAFPENKKMLSDFKSIFLSWDKIPRKAYEFWISYWWDLVKYLNFDDPFIALHKNEVPEFRDFYDTAKWVWWDNEFTMKQDDIWVWVYSKNTTSLWWAWLINIRWDATWNFWWETSKPVFEMYIKTFKDIKNWTWSIEQKKNLFKEVYEPFERKIVSIFWYHVQTITESWNPIYSQLKSEWLDIVKNQSKPIDYDYQIEKIFNNFMRSSWNSVSNTSTNTKLYIEDILSSN